jgi:hypothetical protein
MTNLDLSQKCGAIVFDELMPSQTEIVFNTSQLQAFADEYLALSSSEPVGVIKEELRREDGAVMHYAHLYSHLPLDSQLFLANPLNQQLLTERNECLEEIKRLNECLRKIKKGSNRPMTDPNVHGWEVFAKTAMGIASDYLYIAINALKNQPASIQKLLEDK